MALKSSVRDRRWLCLEGATVARTSSECAFGGERVRVRIILLMDDPDMLTYTLSNTSLSRKLSLNSEEMVFGDRRRRHVP